jgi:hypothetical protein
MDMPVEVKDCVNPKLDHERSFGRCVMQKTRRAQKLIRVVSMTLPSSYTTSI